MLREVFSDGYKSEFNAIYDTNIFIQNGVLMYPERKEMVHDQWIVSIIGHDEKTQYHCAELPS